MCNHMATPVPTVIHTTAVLPATLPNLRDFSSGVCCVVKTAIGDSHPNMGLRMQQAFCFRSSVLAGDTMMPVMTMSVPSDRRQHTVLHAFYPHRKD